MRRTLLGTLLAAVFLTIPAAGFAQLDEDLFSSDDRYERDIVTVEPSISEDRVYVVEEGDTLWELCELFFNDAWYWPTLWAYNPQITNPHWIFPGDYIYIKPRFDRPETERLLWSKSRFALGPKDVQLLARRKGFIPVKEYRESGTIAASREEKVMLGDLDEIYVTFTTEKKIRPNQRYSIYRIEDEVEHPVTEDLLGYKVRFLGLTNVIDASTDKVSAVITRSYEEIERGDLITAPFEHISRLAPRRNAVELDGVLAAFFAEGTMAGEQHYVFLDKGADDGVERGNRFVVLIRGDGMQDDPDEDDLEGLPWETIGEAMVVEPYEKTSLAVLTRSVRELTVGMKVRMIKGY